MRGETMSRIILTCSLISALAFTTNPALAQSRDVAEPEPKPRAALTAYLKLPDIEGETTRTAYGKLWTRGFQKAADDESSGPARLRGNVEGAADVDHDNWIIIESATFDTAGASLDRGDAVLRAKERDESSSGAGKVRFERLNVVKKTDTSTSMAGDQQRTRGDTTLGDVVIVREMDKSTPLLMHRELDASTRLLIVTGQFLGCEPGGTLPIAEVSNGRRAWLVRNLVVEGCATSWSTSGDADDRPTEEVAFYYNKIAFTYSGRDAIAISEVETSQSGDDEAEDSIVVDYGALKVQYGGRDMVLKGKKILQN